MANAQADFTLRLIDKLTRPARSAQRALQGLGGAAGKVGRGGGIGAFVADTGRGLGMVAGAAMTAVKAIGTVAFGAAALGGAAAFGIAKLGSNAEQSQNQIAGFLDALGFSSSFQDGLEKADGIIRQIKQDSAALPGEAEDYIQVFKAGLPVLQGALGKNLADITAFSNKFTAVTNTLGVDTEQAARDLQAMLRVGRGGAGNDVRSFTQMLPFLQQIEGQAKLTAESFNALTQSQRAELLTKAMGKLDPMLANAAGSFDAMLGALKTSGSEILRLATKPLFEAMKTALGEANLALMDADGNLTPFAQKIVDAGKSVADFLVPALKATWNLIKEAGGAFMESFSGDGFKSGFEEILNFLKSPDTIQAVKDMGTFMGHVGTALGVVFKWATMLIGPLFQIIGVGTQMMNVVFEAFAGIGRLGDSIMMGLINSIRGLIPSLVAAMRDSATQSLASFKAVFGIASPSREMALVGEQITAGMSGGIDTGAPQVESSAQRIGSATTAGALAGAEDAGGAGAGGGITFAPQITVNAGSGANAQEIAAVTERTVRASFMRLMESMAPA